MTDLRTRSTSRPMPAERPGYEPEPDLPHLIQRLRHDSTDLLREEVALLRAEVAEKTGIVVRNVAYLAGGGLVTYLGIGLVLFAIATGLAAAAIEAGMAAEIATWLAPLVVGLVTALVGYGLVKKAITTLREERLYPEETVETLKEDVEWAKDKARELK